jgi:hypothetical protein
MYFLKIEISNLLEITSATTQRGRKAKTSRRIKDPTRDGGRCLKDSIKF